MPKVEVEILRTRTTTIEESAVVELNIPQTVIDDEVLSWVEEKYTKGAPAFVKLIDDAMEISDEQEEVVFSEACVVE